ncbi:MAG TPA: Spy/CpxP family protein refolding chaperone [Polyangia bacterium]|nr:Spy/CpxP family protein refolding chaperone [Polyangia bacterium]
MKNRMMVAGFLGLAVLLVAAGAEAGRGRGRGGFGQRDGIGPRLAQELGLSQGQIDQIKDLAEARRADDAKIVADLGKLREELHAEWTADNPREKTILALHDRMDPLRKKLRTSQVRFRFDLLGVLTPEQRAKFQQLKQDRFKKRGERKAKGPGGDGTGRGLGKPGFERRGGPGAF